MSNKICLADSKEEFEELFRFRYKVYVEEQGLSPAGVDHEKKLFADELDQHSKSWYICTDNEIIGSLRLTCLGDLPDLSLLKGKFNFGSALEVFQKNQICTTSRFVLSSKVSGRSALYLMKEGMLYAINRGLKLNYGDCSPHMLPFYNRLGYRIYTKAYHDLSYGYKFPIVMLIGDNEWLEKVQSPLRYLDIKPSGESKEWFELSYPEHLRKQSLYLENPLKYLEEIQVEEYGIPYPQVQVLDDLTASEKMSLLARAAIIDCEKGDIICRPDIHDDTLYIVISGRFHLCSVSVGTSEIDCRKMFSNSSRFFRDYSPIYVEAQRNGKLLVLGRDVVAYLERLRPGIVDRISDEIGDIIKPLCFAQCAKIAV